jgi:hypothetical protein
MILQFNFKFFWNGIKFLILDCLNESLEKENFSVSQRQGLINYMPSKRRKTETFYEKLASNHTPLY